MPYLTSLASLPAPRGRLVVLPDDQRFIAALAGQLLELTQASNWEQFDGITVAEMTSAAQALLESFWERRRMLIGAIVHYISTTPPDGVIPMDGSVYQAADYPELFAILPAAYILDPDTFQLPDASGMFLLSASTGHVAGSTGGAETHVLTVAELPAHHHGYEQYTFGVDIETLGVPDPTGVGQPLLPELTDDTGSGDAHNNLPPFIAMSVGVVAR